MKGANLLKHVPVGPGIAEVSGTDESERFHITASKKNPALITIDNFELGSDKLHFGKVNADGFEFAWIDADGDAEANDLQITMGSQIVVLTDLAEQIVTPPQHRWFQGFESDTDGWFDSNSAWYGSVTRVASGTDGVDSADGSSHAVFEGDSSSAPFTRFGGYQDTYIGGWTTSVEIYLDANDDGSGWAAGEGFDYSSAATGSDGNHQRDFIFHVTQDTSSGELLINASNNTNFAPREDLDALAGTAAIDEDGWYTFQQVFYDDGGVLAVDMNVLDADGNLVFSKTLSSPVDVISEIGGNRYGWFTVLDVDGGIAVDNASLLYEVEQTTPFPDPGDIFFV